MYFYSRSCKGYSHVKDNKVCQDFSSSYNDKERTIVTTCDGHGGNIYIRSELGSKFASNAIINVFRDIDPNELRGFVTEEYINKIRLSILCEWNNQVERHLNSNPFKRSELAKLDENEIRKLKASPEKAYGTTLIGAMLLNNKLVVVHLGDGESLLFKKGEITPVFIDDDDEPVANITYSMCAEDAYNHIKIKVLSFNEYDGVIICTDGMINPYQNYTNFKESMVKPLVLDLIETKSTEKISNFVDKLGYELGIGDDVSLGFIVKEGIKTKYYR